MNMNAVIEYTPDVENYDADVERDEFDPIPVLDSMALSDVLELREDPYEVGEVFQAIAKDFGFTKDRGLPFYVIIDHDWLGWYLTYREQRNVSVDGENVDMVVQYTLEDGGTLYKSFNAFTMLDEKNVHNIYPILDGTDEQGNDDLHRWAVTYGYAWPYSHDFTITFPEDGLAKYLARREERSLDEMGTTNLPPIVRDGDEWLVDD